MPAIETRRPNADPATRGLLDRRSCLRAMAGASIAPAALTWAAPTARAASDSLQRFPRTVHEYFVQQVRSATDRHRAAYDRLQTREDAERYVKSVRAKIRQCFGPEPARTPLNAHITGRLEREAYTIEKVVFESRPHFPVTANLYLPSDLSSPRPGVVGTCGHSSNGKAAEPYQSFAQGLARLGYVCLIYDPIGQGERFQYLTEELKARLGPGVREHIQAGNQQFLVGDFLGMWRAWDGIRALDYLLTRPEVDRRHLGVTGNSGGGTMTTWLCGVEPRWTMAAPSCFVTMFQRNMENELPADTEQCPPRALALGLDHIDFIAAMAPKPVVLLTKERDYFDIRGGEEAIGRLRHLYRLLGAPDNISLFTGPTTHGYSQENREAMYGWFNRATGASDARIEPDITLEKDEDLWCTPRGQVGVEAGVKKVFDFTAAKAGRLAEQRKPLKQKQLITAIEQVLHPYPASAPHVADRDDAPSFRILRSRRTPKFPKPYTCTYVLETEPGMLVPVYMLTDSNWFSRPPQDLGRVVLYVGHRSSDAELADNELLREVIKADPQAAVFACDVRGVGETRPNTCGVNSFNNPYGCDYFYSIHSLMLDRSYLGQKIYDLLRVLDWLAACGSDRVHLVARGWGALAGCLAAVLSARVRQVTLEHALNSWTEVAVTEDYAWPLATMPNGVLQHFDLPDCYRALRAKQLRLVAPWGPGDGLNA